MNKKLSTQIFDKFNGAVRSAQNGVKKFFEEYDIASLPAFVIFMVVVTAGMAVNYFFLVTLVQPIEAFSISMLFELGIFGWKLQSHRIKNSDAQDEIVNWVMWISTILAFAMLFSSLTGANYWGWIVAAAAVTHVVGFLLFDQNDDIRNNKRSNRMALERITQKQTNSTNAIQEAEADLKIINKITMEISRLRQTYSHLPKNELEFVLETTRTRLLVEYKASANVDQATQSQSDIDGDGMIGDGLGIPADIHSRSDQYRPR